VASVPDRIILCADCGTKNRIPPDKSGAAKCGRCGHVINTGNNPNSENKLLWIAIGIAGAAIVLFAIVYAPSIDRPQRLDTAGLKPVTFPNNAERPAAPKPELIPVAITTGVIFARPSSQTAPLDIRTPVGSNYYVKLSEPYSRQIVLTAYIEGGRTLSAEVPLGHFQLHYATGSQWYGAAYLFGRNTSYFKAEKTFDFQIQGNEIRGYTVELIKQIGGNLRTRSISASDFN
jgi:hypothetical protein